MQWDLPAYVRGVFWLPAGASGVAELPTVELEVDPAEPTLVLAFPEEATQSHQRAA